MAMLDEAQVRLLAEYAERKMHEMPEGPARTMMEHVFLVAIEVLDHRRRERAESER